LRLADHGFMSALNRLEGVVDYKVILGQKIPKITLPVAPGRNMSILIECAVRNQMLKNNGYDASADFMKRHDEYMDVVQD